MVLDKLERETQNFLDDDYGEGLGNKQLYSMLFSLFVAEVTHTQKGKCTFALTMYLGWSKQKLKHLSKK